MRRPKARQVYYWPEADQVALVERVHVNGDDLIIARLTNGDWVGDTYWAFWPILVYIGRL